MSNWEILWILLKVLIDWIESLFGILGLTSSSSIPLTRSYTHLAWDSSWKI